MRTATGSLTAHACDVTVVNGYKAPCPLREFVEGCVFQCGDTANCEEVRSGADTTRLCYSLHHIHCSKICCMAACTSDCTLHHVQCMNNTEPILITPTAEACQVACAKHQQCAAFQWVGVGDNESATARHHQCSFKCAGAVTPGRTQCSLGHKVGTAGGSYICGPKHNDSSAPAPPGPPPPTKPTGPPCPVPFGLTGEYVSVATLCFCYILAIECPATLEWKPCCRKSFMFFLSQFVALGGSVEAGTDHARAGNTGTSRHDLICQPWCLFNLTADIGAA